MGWLPSPDEVSCAHVACAGFTGCGYQPPAIGPELPHLAIASDGTRWWRNEGSRVFYRQRVSGEQRDGVRYQLATWHELLGRAEGREPYSSENFSEDFPAGPVLVADGYDGAEPVTLVAVARTAEAMA